MHRRTNGQAQHVAESLGVPVVNGVEKKIVVERRVVNVDDVVAVGAFIAGMGKSEMRGGYTGGEAFQAFCDLLDIPVDTMFELVGPPKDSR